MPVMCSGLLTCASANGDVSTASSAVAAAGAEGGASRSCVGAGEHAKAQSKATVSKRRMPNH
jgi:hypothetical protein